MCMSFFVSFQCRHWIQYVWLMRRKKGIRFNMTFYNPMKEFNCVNTLLEIDLYPSLFSEWWEEEMSPLNYGVRLKKYAGESIKAYDDIHYESFLMR